MSDVGGGYLKSHFVNYMDIFTEKNDSVFFQAMFASNPKNRYASRSWKWNRGTKWENFSAIKLSNNLKQFKNSEFRFTIF